MFPGHASDIHPDPSNASATTTQPTSSSPIISSAASSFTAETTSCSYLHQHPHLHHQFPPHQLQDKQQPIGLHNVQHQWPLASYYPLSDVAARDAERILTDQNIYRQQYIQQQMGSMISREEPQMQHLHPSVGASMQMQGISMMPAVEQFYNEQLLRSLGRATGPHHSGIEPRSIYSSLQAGQELQMANQSGSSHVLSRTLENIGRTAAGADAAAGVRYEETCTPRPRWCPTQEQIQILESLFNSGTTTPSRDMIVDIAAQLRKYGTIAEANVFYWFQNRKARAKRKLQTPAAFPQVPPLNPQCVSSAGSEAEHAAPESTHLSSSGAGPTPGFEHAAAQSKSRRMSLKQTAASSPSSSSSPDPHHVAGGPASPSPLQQQPMKPSSLQQDSTLLVPNRAAAGTASTPIQASLYSWPHQQHLERLPTEEGQEARPASVPYPQFLFSRAHEESPIETSSHPEAFRHLLDYPRISLSLAPPTQHHSLQSSQVLGRTRGGILGFNTQSDPQFFQATSKGIMLMDPQDSLSAGPIIGGSSSTSSTISSAFLSQLGASRHMAEIDGSRLISQVQSEQLPQSSLPVARAGDQQIATKTAEAAASMAEREQEQQLQMWEDLDSCPWSAGQSHH